MTWSDAAGLAGVLVILVAYAGTSMGWLDPKRLFALACNFVGASLVLLSLSQDFNLSAVVMESAWAVIALLGLARLAARRFRP